MKLNCSTSLLTSFIYIHIIILHVITQANSQASDDAHNVELDDNPISKENKKIIIEQIKAKLLKVLDLKEAPKKPQNKALVPKAMLEEYRKLRDSVRDTIPEDRDFYGKINIEDLDENHENFWTSVANKYGTHDIEVDMNQSSNSKDHGRRHVKRDQMGSNQMSRRDSKQSAQNQRARPKSKPPRTDKCSKKSLMIHFDDVGWSSWIIAPQAYYADYCAGDCTFPMSDYQNATNHAIIQSIYHVVGRVVPRSCCAPTKLGKMAILYQIDGGVQMKHYDDMLVESCGCL